MRKKQEGIGIAYNFRKKSLTVVFLKHSSKQRQLIDANVAEICVAPKDCY